MVVFFNEIRILKEEVGGSVVGWVRGGRLLRDWWLHYCSPLDPEKGVNSGVSRETDGTWLLWTNIQAIQTTCKNSPLALIRIAWYSWAQIFCQHWALQWTHAGMGRGMLLWEDQSLEITGHTKEWDELERWVRSPRLQVEIVGEIVYIQQETVLARVWFETRAREIEVAITG